MIGPAMDTALSRYLAGPLVPTVLGHDARLQLLHEQDALGALERATMAGKSGTFNIGAPGIIMMSQAIRRSGRVPLPVPRSALCAVDSLRRATRYTELDREQLDYLSYGRVMDTTRMRNDLGYQPEVDNRGGVRRLRPRSWIDSDHRPAMGTLYGESRRGCGAALGSARLQQFKSGGRRYNVAGESKAKVIPLHSNSGRSSAQRRAPRRSAESSRRHPSLLTDPADAPRPSSSPPSSARSISVAPRSRHRDRRGARQPNSRKRIARRGRIPPQADDRRLHRRRVRVRPAPQ